MSIGILGGMGPAASAESYLQLIRICQHQYNAVEDDDFPPHYSTQHSPDGF